MYRKMYEAKLKKENIFKGVRRAGFFLWIFMLVLACGSKKKSQFFLSNPMDTVMTVKVDGQEHTLEPRSFKKIKLDAGNHSYEYGGEKTEFLVTFENEGGVINPTETAHILFNMIYETEDSKTNFRTINNEVIIDNVPYEAPVNISRQKVIDAKLENIKYDLETPFPKSIKVSSTSDGNIHTKIFMPTDFIKFYEEETGATGGSQLDKPFKGEIEGVEREYASDKKGAVPDHKDQGLKEKAQKLADLDNAYKEAGSASEQKKISSDFKKLYKDYLKELMKAGSGEREAGTATYRYIGRGVILK